MYKYRVGIIAEGPTDISVIQGIVKNIFPNLVFVFYPISPTPEELSLQKKAEGFGWGGVYRVCRRLSEKLQFAEEISGPFDCVVVHIDADVAYKKYSDIDELYPPMNDLPCASTDDRYDEACFSLERVLFNWMDMDTDKIVPCIPCICTETWVGCWLYPEQWCDVKEDTDEKIVYEYLYRLGAPKSEKFRRIIKKRSGDFKKHTQGYRSAADILSGELWSLVTERYTQAKLFDEKINEVIGNRKRIV